MIVILSSIFAVFSLVIFWSLTGIAISRFWIVRNVLPVSLRIGGGYFLGVMLSMVLFKLGNYLLPQHAREIFIAILVLECFILLPGIREALALARQVLSHLSLLSGFMYGVVAVILLLFPPIFWLFPFESLACSNHIGSGHSGFYGNMALAFTQMNWVQVVDVHSTQSMLTAALMLLGFGKVYLILSLWLSFSSGMLFLTFIGLFQYIGLGRAYSWWGTILLYVGQTTLSILPVVSTDNFFPYLSISYTDAILGAGTSVLFFIWMNELDGTNKTSTILFPAVASIFLCFTSEHWLSIIIPAMIILLYWRMVGSCLTRRVYLYAIMGMIVGSLVGLTQGGALTPRTLLDSNQFFPIYGNKFIKYKFSPGLLVYVRTLPWDNESENKNIQIRPAHNDSPIMSFSEEIWQLEQRFWESLRYIFFPFVGILLLLFLTLHPKTQKSNTDAPTPQALLAVCALLYLLGGYVLTFVISPGDTYAAKFSMSRFLMPGYTWGMLALAVSMYIITLQYAKTSRMLWIAVLTMTSIGPLITYSETIIHRLSNPGEMTFSWTTFFSEPTKLISATKDRPFGCHRRT
ncbi:MAG: hypothetical protein HQL55_03250 [Magnetococcales bacterium]|nr:hypothetical protein [Magnetococcales bacterium]